MTDQGGDSASLTDTYTFQPDGVITIHTTGWSDADAHSGGDLGHRTALGSRRGADAQSGGLQGINALGTDVASDAAWDTLANEMGDGASDGSNWCHPSTWLSSLDAPRIIALLTAQPRGRATCLQSLQLLGTNTDETNFAARHFVGPASPSTF